MTFLARKVMLNKWTKELGVGFADGEISADTVTSDLKTTGNTLSFWKADRPEELWPLATLALAAGSNELDRLDIVVLERATLIANGITVEETPGDTPVADLVASHVDAKNLDSRRLVKIAELLSIAIRQHSKVKRVPKEEVAGLLVEAVRAGRVKLDDLREKVRLEIQRKLARTTSS